MTSILNELYYGKLYPAEQISPSNPEYRPLVRKIDEEIESLKKKLSEEDSARLEKVSADHLELCSVSACDSFSCGVKLGALMMREIFSGENSKE